MRIPSCYVFVATVAAMSILPLTTSHAQAAPAKAPAPQSEGPDYSVPPSPPSKENKIEEALKPSINANLGFRAPVEVMEGSVHEAYLAQDPYYAKYQHKVKVQQNDRRRLAKARKPVVSSPQLKRQEQDIRQKEEHLKRNRQEIERLQREQRALQQKQNHEREEQLRKQQRELQQRQRKLEEERRLAERQAEQLRQEEEQRQESLRRQQEKQQRLRRQQEQKRYPVKVSSGQRPRFRIGG